MRDMDLFQLGDFVLHSGAKSSWKIECNALSDVEIETLAYMIREVVGPYSTVEGIPRGGLRLAKALEPYCVEGEPRDGRHPHLIVDDVLTTDGSMRQAKEAYLARNAGVVLGAVLFARGECPYWIRPLFRMPVLVEMQAVAISAEQRARGIRMAGVRRAPESRARKDA